jgi:hypothetical protein
MPGTSTTRRGLTQALGGMKRITAILVTAVALSSCAGKPVAPTVPADRAFIIGTWTSGNTEESFRPDGTYCAVSRTADRLDYVSGPWHIRPDGIVVVRIERATDPKRLSKEGFYDARQAFRVGQALLIGPPCSHFPNGICGTAYKRLSSPQSACSAHDMPPNNSFKPNPLRGSA